MKKNKERIEELESIVTQLHNNQKILIKNMEMLKEAIKDICNTFA